MIRSLLFVPGNNPGMIQSADVFGADGVIFDLEDSVHIYEKDNARNLVGSFLANHPIRPAKIVVRINSFDSPYVIADLEAIVSDRIDYILLPKATAKDLKQLDEHLTEIEKKTGMQKTIGVIPLIESAASLVEAKNIAFCPRVEAMMLGAEDFTADMGITRTKKGDELAYPRAKLAVICKAYDILAIDTPFTDVNDDLGLRDDALTAMNLGFTGKAAIHPRQVGIINNVFSPTEEKITWAKRVMEAKKDADKKGFGVFSLDGKMIDKPVIARALAIREQARACKAWDDNDEE